MHVDTPSAELAVWAGIVLLGTVQHPVLLGHDSWMRFAVRLFFFLPFLAPKTSSPSSRTTEGPPMPSTSSSPKCMKFHFCLRRLFNPSTRSAPRVSRLSPATIWFTCFPVTTFPLNPKSTSPVCTKQSRSRDSPTSNQATSLGTLLLPSYNFQHRPSKTSSRDQCPPRSMPIMTIFPGPMTDSLGPSLSLDFARVSDS